MGIAITILTINQIVSIAAIIFLFYMLKKKGVFK